MAEVETAHKELRDRVPELKPIEKNSFCFADPGGIEPRIPSFFYSDNFAGRRQLVHMVPCRIEGHAEESLEFSEVNAWGKRDKLLDPDPIVSLNPQGSLHSEQAGPS